MYNYHIPTVLKGDKSHPLLLYTLPTFTPKCSCMTLYQPEQQVIPNEKNTSSTLPMDHLPWTAIDLKRGGQVVADAACVPLPFLRPWMLKCERQQKFLTIWSNLLAISHSWWPKL